MTDIENKYERKLTPLDLHKGIIDAYLINTHYDNSELVKHAIKKLLCPGMRHDKTYKQDIEEARNQLIIELANIELAEKLENGEPIVTGFDLAEPGSDQSNLVSVTMQTLYDYGPIPEGSTHYSPHHKMWIKQSNTYDCYWDDTDWCISTAIPGDSITIEELNKPKEGFININGYEVPEPERKTLKIGQVYFVAGTDKDESGHRSEWDNDACDNDRLEKGIIHMTSKASKIHTSALLSFTKIEEGKS